MRTGWLLLIVLVSISVLVQARSTGPPAATVVGDDGCSCHGAASSGTAVTVNAPASYAPGQKVTITVSSTTTTVNAGVNKGGFLAWVSAGTFSAPSTNANHYQTEPLDGKSVIKHTLAGDQQNLQQQWSFDWTAPAAGTGQVQLKVFVNRVNGDGGNGGDGWNKQHKTIAEGAASGSSSASTATTSAGATTAATSPTSAGTTAATSPSAGTTSAPQVVSDPAPSVLAVLVALVLVVLAFYRRR